MLLTDARERSTECCALIPDREQSLREGGMPVSVVVGGQFGSEGKGKTALEIVRRDRTVAAAIRVGGTNSGHTAISSKGRRYALRQLPAASVDRTVRVILPSGSYIDLGVFAEEVRRLSSDLPKLGSVRWRGSSPTSTSRGNETPTWAGRSAQRYQAPGLR